jgi:hypothetical protein
LLEEYLELRGHNRPADSSWLYKWYRADHACRCKIDGLKSDAYIKM